MNSVRKNFEVLQAGRGLAALAVVGFHSNVVYALPKYFGSEPAFLFRSGDSGVYFFFVLSGLVMILAHYSDFGERAAVGRFLWKRARRIYPPLWLMLAVMLVLLVVFPSFSSLGIPNAFDIFNAFIAGPVNIKLKEPLITVEWTLRREILFYCIFSVSIWKPKFGIKILIIWLIFCVISTLYEFEFPFSFMFAPEHVLFGMGILIGLRIWRDPILQNDFVYVAAGVGIFAGFWIAAVLSHSIHESPIVSWGFGLGASSMTLGLVSMEQRGAIGIPKFLKLLGDASYSIYLVHFLVVSASTKIVLVLSRHVHFPALVWWLVICGAGVAAGVVFHITLERPMLKMRIFKRPAMTKT